MKRLILSLMMVLLLPALVSAYCSSPSAPDPPGTYERPDKPSVPYCINTFSNTHTCSQWEIDSYKSALQQYKYDVEDYIRKLQNYVDEANDFVNEAVDYANCEIRNID